MGRRGAACPQSKKGIVSNTRITCVFLCPQASLNKFFRLGKLSVQDAFTADTRLRLGVGAKGSSEFDELHFTVSAKKKVGQGGSPWGVDSVEWGWGWEPMCCPCVVTPAPAPHCQLREEGATGEILCACHFYVAKQFFNRTDNNKPAAVASAAQLK